LAFTGAVATAIFGLLIAIVLVIGPIGWAALIFGVPVWIIGTSLILLWAAERSGRSPPPPPPESLRAARAAYSPLELLPKGIGDYASARTAAMITRIFFLPFTPT
jgi:hypothetical protein